MIGSNGQDGMLISQLFSEKGFLVYGVIRESDQRPTPHWLSGTFSIGAKDPQSLLNILDKISPEIIIHVAAVHGSSDNLASLESKRKIEIQNISEFSTELILKWQTTRTKTKSVFALSSHMYNGYQNNLIIDLDISTKPVGAYAHSKVKMWELIKTYRNEHDVHASGLVMFNHTSRYSKSEYLFPQLASAIATAYASSTRQPIVFSHDALVDISDAEDFVEAIFKISQHQVPKDWILGQGELVRITSLISKTCSFMGFSDYSLLYKKLDLGPVKVSNIDETIKLLDWQPKRSPAMLLSKMVELKISGR